MITFINVDPTALIKSCAIDNPVNRQYDQAACEIRTKATFWFKKAAAKSPFAAYKLTHWNGVEVPTDSALRQEVKKNYSADMSKVIFDLLEGFNLAFMTHSISSLTKFNELRDFYFRSIVA